ncbi:MAG: LUD domain-containing protein [Haloarculaceae archaeon]
MSTGHDIFRQTLSERGLETVQVTPEEVGTAIEEFVVGDEAVGIPGEDWPDSLPASVDWNPTPAALRSAKTGVTPAEFAIADYGSLVLPTAPPACELVSLYVDRHVAVLDRSDVVPDMKAAFERLDGAIAEDYSDAIIATGPSATADMGELVEGAHGPSEVRLVQVED